MFLFYENSPWLQISYEAAQQEMKNKIIRLPRGQRTIKLNNFWTNSCIISFKTTYRKTD